MSGSARGTRPNEEHLQRRRAGGAQGEAASRGASSIISQNTLASVPP